MGTEWAGDFTDTDEPDDADMYDEQLAAESAEDAAGRERWENERQDRRRWERVDRDDQRSKRAMIDEYVADIKRRFGI